MRRILEHLGERIAAQVLLRGTRVVWPGLGVFYPRDLNAFSHVIRATPNGIPVHQRFHTPARTVVGFRPGKHAKRRRAG